MSDRRSPLIVAGPSESLHDVLARLVAAGRTAGPADLVVPRDSGLLLTAGEFRELKDVIDRDRLSVTLYCDDPLRKQLAELMGIQTQRIPPGWLAAARPAATRPAQPQQAAPARPAASPVMPQPAPPVQRPPLPSPLSPSALPRPDWASPLPTTADRGTGWPVVAPTQAAPLSPEPDAVEPTFDQIVDRKHRGGGFPRWLGFTLGALVLLALGALALALLLPQASVRLTLQHQPVSGAIPFDVTATGSPLDTGASIALAAAPLETELSFETTIPVTGRQLLPDGVASGSVDFANPGLEAVTVPAGTELDGGEMAFNLDADMTVPAMDPATGASGIASGKVTATAGGSAGNVLTGEIGGRLPSGVYYSNRAAALSGGSDIEIEVVSAEDVAGLKAQAEAALAPNAGAFTNLPDGVRLLPQSVRSLAETMTFTAREGETTDSLGVTATRQIRGLGYDQAAVERELAAGAAEALAPMAPAGFMVQPASVEVTAVTPVSETADGARFTAEITADAVAAFTEADARALAERLTGADAAAAEVILTSTPGVAGFDIEYRAEWLPEWLPKRMPSDPGRIEIELAS